MSNTAKGPIQRLIAVLLEKRSPAEMVAALKSLERPQRSKALEREIKDSIEELTAQIAADLKHQTLATALAILFVDADYSIGKLRRDGVLRASKYEFRGVLITHIVKTALNARVLLDAREERIDYLRSVLALTKLAPSALTLHARILKILRTRVLIATEK